jgi:hypothetical protein
MPWVGFEPTIQAFERAKTVHNLDREDTVIGKTRVLQVEIYCILFSTHGTNFPVRINYLPVYVPREENINKYVHLLAL